MKMVSSLHFVPLTFSQKACLLNTGLEHSRSDVVLKQLGLLNYFRNALLAGECHEFFWRSPLFLRLSFYKKADLFSLFYALQPCVQFVIVDKKTERKKTTQRRRKNCCHFFAKPLIEQQN